MHETKVKLNNNGFNNGIANLGNADYTLAHGSCVYFSPNLT
ncbi:4769_t:CDS:2 [Ambispora leptoticha]|uniref:4769_t:CDS:1 n=1 Tax=Ambispora leptoticha TaxID=144679 RepID=A0A9N8ZR30_9GLOM|nr:4769_t:CDS:2 [Ambispora leptoticha]